MPRGNGTGPMGDGPMTGWGRGYCMTTRPIGAGVGTRRGMSRGMDRGMVGENSAWEKEALEEEREVLKKRIERIEKKLEAALKE